MPNRIQKLLTSQLGAHLQVHVDPGDQRRVRVLDSDRAPAKSVQRTSHVLSIAATLKIYSGSCGMMARGDFESLRESGLIVLVTSSSGVDLYVEVGGTLKEPQVVRVSSGAIAIALKKAIERSGGKRGRRLEMRVLRVAGMHLSAVWAHSPQKQPIDTFIPYTPNFAGLRLGRVYTFRRINFLLKKHAIQMILRWYDRHEKDRSAARLDSRLTAPHEE